MLSKVSVTPIFQSITETNQQYSKIWSDLRIDIVIQLLSYRFHVNMHRYHSYIIASTLNVWPIIGICTSYYAFGYWNECLWYGDQL